MEKIVENYIPDLVRLWSFPKQPKIRAEITQKKCFSKEWNYNGSREGRGQVSRSPGPRFKIRIAISTRAWQRLRAGSAEEYKVTSRPETLFYLNVGGIVFTVAYGVISRFGESRFAVWLNSDFNVTITLYWSFLCIWSRESFCGRACWRRTRKAALLLDRALQASERQQWTQPHDTRHDLSQVVEYAPAFLKTFVIFARVDGFDLTRYASLRQYRVARLFEEY